MRVPLSAPPGRGLPPPPRLQRQRRQARGGSASGSGSSSGSGSASPPPLGAATQTFVLNHLSGAGSLSYTLDVTVDGQTLPVQVDTGSSDLWLASTRCSTSACQGGANGEVTLFNPRGVTNSGANANITYPQGAVNGPIVTSPTLYVGPGETPRIDGQAFISAASVSNFQLGPGNFTGILGLGPPAGSVVQSQLYAQSGNTNPGNSESDYGSTGSVLPALLHGIPLGSRYISLGLRRLPSEGGKGDSTLVLGGIDTNFVPSAAAVHSETVAEGPGIALDSDSDDSGDTITSYRKEPRWRTYVRELSIDVSGDNTTLPMQSTLGADYPIALFSSATSYSLAPASFLNAFYGAYGYQPSSDGGYYVPCTTMLNVTLQLGESKVAVPIHPLDLSLVQQNDGSSDSSYCLGGFQAIEGPKGTLNGAAMEGADVVIGTAMMRSIYTVYICDSMNGTHTTGSSSCNPQVGFYPLVDDMAQARWEFDQVRVHGKSLGPDPKTRKSGSGGLSPGIKALIGVLCAVAGIVLIMLAVVLWMRRQRKQRHAQAIAMKIQSRAEPKQGDGFVGPAGAGAGPGASSQVMSDKTPGSLGAAVPTVSRTGRMSDESFHSPAESMRSNWTGNQLEHARQINLMNGVFDEEVGQPGDDDPAARAAAGVAANFGHGSSPTDGEGATASVGLDSSHYDPNDPYRDAKKIKGAYLKKHPSFERGPPASDTADPFASDTSPDKEASLDRELPSLPAEAASGAGAAAALAAVAGASAARAGTESSDPFATHPPTSGESEGESEGDNRATSRPAWPAVVTPAPASSAVATTTPAPPPKVERTQSAASGNTAYASLDEPMQDLASLPGAQAAVMGGQAVHPPPSTPSPRPRPVGRTSPVSPASPSRSSPPRKPVPTEAPKRTETQAPRVLPHPPSRPTEAENQTKPAAPAAQPRPSTTVPAPTPVQLPAYPAPAAAPAVASKPSVKASVPAPSPTSTPVPTDSSAPPKFSGAVPAVPGAASAPGLAPPLALQTSAPPAAQPSTQPSAAASAAPPARSAPAPVATTQAQQANASTAPSIPSPLNPVPGRPPPARSPAASVRTASGPAPPRANLMSPPSMRAASGPAFPPSASAGAAWHPTVAPDMFFDPALLPPPLPSGGRGDTNALAHQLYRATAGTTSAFNPSGSVSGTATPAGWSPTSSLVSPTQSFTPAHHVRMRPAFLQQPQGHPPPSSSRPEGD